MAKVLGLRQQRVQFFYDTDFRCHGVSAGNDIAASEKILFAGATPGDLSRTNMPSPGQLTSDQTFLCFAVRHEINFYPMKNKGSGTILSGDLGLTNISTPEQLMIWTCNSSTFSFKVSEKIEFEGPVTMTPAGGGPSGVAVQDATAIGLDNAGYSVLTNGNPQSGSIYVLPLPVAITKRQGIQMIEKKFALSSTSIVDEINGYLGAKLFRAYIDGYNTRDVL